MKKRIFIAMDSDGTIECATDVDDLHSVIAENGHLLSGYRTVAIDVDMTPPKAIDDESDPEAAIAVPDDATEAPQAAIA